MPPMQILSSTSRQDLLHLWHQALASPLGIIVVVSDFAGARSGLIAARKGSGEKDLFGISLIHSPYSPQTELWLIKRTPNGPADAGTLPVDLGEPD